MVVLGIRKHCTLPHPRDLRRLLHMPACLLRIAFQLVILSTIFSTATFCQMVRWQFLALKVVVLRYFSLMITRMIKAYTVFTQLINENYSMSLICYIAQRNNRAKNRIFILNTHTLKQTQTMM